MFYDERRDEFDAEALTCTGINQPLQEYGTKVRQRSGLAYQIVHERVPVFIPDTLLNSQISQVAVEKGRRAMVGVPLLDHEGPVGVLWVNWRQPRQVSSTEGNLFTSLASQATVAIKGARRYEELRRRSSHLEAVHEAGKVISAASVGLDRQLVLDRILEQAIECVTDISGPKASYGTISLLDEDTQELVVKSVFPQQQPQLSFDKFDRISLDPQEPHPGKIGISGRAVLSGQAQLVVDVSTDKDYIVQDPNTKSELAVPLLDDARVIGVMDVESDELNGFDELDKDALSLLVDMAVVALNNAERAEKLARSNTVALMGAWGAEIAHDVNREVGYIRRETFMLQERDDLPSDVKARLSAIEQSAENLAMPQKETDTESWLPSQISCNLAQTIHKAVNRYRDTLPPLAWQYDPGAQDIQVAIHERRLLSILSHLFRNAIQVLSKGDYERVITIRTSVTGKLVVIEVEDSGPGMPPEMAPILFRETIYKDGRIGSGLLLIRFISEQYGGRVELGESQEGSGACFRVSLPIVFAEDKL